MSRAGSWGRLFARSRDRLDKSCIYSSLAVLPFVQYDARKRLSIYRLLKCSCELYVVDSESAIVLCVCVGSVDEYGLELGLPTSW